MEKQAREQALQEIQTTLRQWEMERARLQDELQLLFVHMNQDRHQALNAEQVVDQKRRQHMEMLQQ